MGIHDDLYNQAHYLNREKREAFFKSDDLPPRRLEKILEIAIMKSSNGSRDPVAVEMREQLWIVLADKYASAGFTSSFIERKRERYLDALRRTVYEYAGLSMADIDYLKKQLADSERQPVAR